ncbi:hypothetical protein Ct61P_11217 [Colletotrichum tofieldiae]|nr:hypothetical protein Ct61P_11217 [Colletotrichum tofieldiae]
MAAEQTPAPRNPKPPRHLELHHGTARHLGTAPDHRAHEQLEALSWNKEDQKRELQMSHIDDVKTGPGFTERA